MSHTALRASFDADWHNLEGAFASHGDELVQDRMSKSNSLSSCSLILLRYKPQHNILTTVADGRYYHHRLFSKTVETATSRRREYTQKAKMRLGDFVCLIACFFFLSL